MSHNQPGQYGHDQQQRPGPFGQQGGQPGSDDQPSYGQQPNPFSPLPPPSPSSGRKNTGIIVGAVAALAAIAGGVYYFTASDSGSSVADDGPHKLSTPSAVLGGEYEKNSSSSSVDGFTASEIKEAQRNGVRKPTGVDASYSTADTTDSTGKTIRFVGLYGEIDAPEKVVDGMFAKMRADDAKNTEGVELVGTPRDFSTDGAVLKCQETKFRNGLYDGTPENGPKTMKVAICIWGDHSTIARVIPMNISEALAGSDLDLQESAALAAQLRKDVRMKN